MSLLFLAVPLSCFWAGILSYIPSALYLLLNPLEDIDAEKAQAQGIFLIRDEVKLEKQKARRVKGVFFIYVVCVLVVLSVYILNYFKIGELSLVPFDIFSALFIIIFALSFLSYLPFAAYLVIKKPWDYSSPGLSVRKMFVVYGICLLLFSFVYAYHWLNAHNIIIDSKEYIAIVTTFIVAGGVISYLPILFYILVTVPNPSRRRGARPTIIFVIYSSSFLLFSLVYLINWFINIRSDVLISP